MNFRFDLFTEIKTRGVMDLYSENFQKELDRERDPEALWAAVNARRLNPELSQTMLIDLANSGSILSMFYLGDMLENGRGVPKNVEQADNWYRMAANNGSIEASFRLAFGYWHSRNYEKAISELYSLCKVGYTPAFYCLGSFYYTGTGVEKNFYEAVKLWQTAKNLGHIISTQRLALMAIKGDFGILRIPLGICELIRLAPKYIWYKKNFPNSDLVRCW